MSESMVDEFGIRKIYPTNTHPNRAKPWLLGKGNWKDRRYERSFDGNWDDYLLFYDFDNNLILEHWGGTKGRFPVLALPSDKYPIDDSGGLIYVTETNQSKLKKRGFMGTKQDWKNVEITLYWRIKDTINDPNKTKHMGFSARGGPHHSSGGIWGIDPCCGTALYVGLTFSGKPGVAKELRHADYTDDLYIDSVTDGDLRDRWIGMKGIFYTKANGNPYIELWLDKKANNNWELILQKEDAGGWSIQDDNGNPTSNKCGGAPDEQITWGGPGIIFKLDGLTRVDMKWGSVREIMPPEGWPLRYLLHTRGVSFPVSMRSMAEEYGLTAPIFLRELTESEAERPRD